MTKCSACGEMPGGPGRRGFCWSCYGAFRGKVCRVDECDKWVRARGLCVSHYNDLIAPGERHKKYATACYVCGKALVKQKSGQRKTVCSYSCRRLVQMAGVHGEHLAMTIARDVLSRKSADELRAARLPVLAPPSCAIPERHPARLLAQRQAGRWWGQVVGVRCVWCGTWALVVMSTGVPVRSLPTHCSEACTKAHQKSKGRRRIRKTYVEPTHWRKVASRDGLRCYICNRLTRPNDFKWVVGSDGRRAFKVGHRYPTVDHVEALAAGGEHSMANARIACRECSCYLLRKT